MKPSLQDYEKLIKLRKEALAEPVKFVEKLQNNVCFSSIIL